MAKTNVFYFGVLLYGQYDQFEGKYGLFNLNQPKPLDRFQAKIK
jgi:hypothetical protein